MGTCHAALGALVHSLARCGHTPCALLARPRYSSAPLLALNFMTQHADGTLRVDHRHRTAAAALAAALAAAVAASLAASPAAALATAALAAAAVAAASLTLAPAASDVVQRCMCRTQRE